MKFVYYVQICFIICLVKSEEIDWCNMQNCVANTHIACNNNGSWYPQCVDQYEIPLSDSDKQLIVDEHNKNRNKIAFGQIPGFSTALRMGRLSWNDTLAWLAGLNTKQCSMTHDLCRNTPSYSYAGQNLYMMYSWSGATTTQVINRMIPKWFNEWMLGNGLDINRFTLDSLGKGIGHFTQMIQDQGSEVGCAMSSFSTSCGLLPYRGYLVACNYDCSNMRGSPVYVEGETAAGCETGPDDEYPGLCSKQEVIDPNAYFPYLPTKKPLDIGHIDSRLTFEKTSLSNSYQLLPI